MKRAHRRRLEELIRLLPDDAVPVAGEFLRWLVAEGADPLVHLFARAPLDDEPLTPEEETALREAEDDVAAGRLVPLDAVLRKFPVNG